MERKSCTPIITYTQALKAGLRHYYNGKPCINKHRAKRYVSSRECVKCTAAREKRNRKANPKLANLQARNSRANSRLRAIQHLGNACCKCYVDDYRVLQIDHVKGNGADERRTLPNYRSGLYKRVLEHTQDYQCLCCNCNFIKRTLNRESTRTPNPNSRWAKLRTKVLNAFGSQCIICGVSDPSCLHLDHINGGGRKELKNIGAAAVYRRALKFPGLYQILCANCNYIKYLQDKEVFNADRT